MLELSIVMMTVAGLAALSRGLCALADRRRAAPPAPYVWEDAPASRARSAASSAKAAGA